MVFIDSTFILWCKSKKIRFKLCKISKINKNLNSYLCAMWYSATYRHSVIKSIILIQMSYFKRHAKILLWDIFSGFNDLNLKKLVVHQTSSIYVFFKKNFIPDFWLHDRCHKIRWSNTVFYFCWRKLSRNWGQLSSTALVQKDMVALCLVLGQY
jgi:hypothetical protein